MSYNIIRVRQLPRLIQTSVKYDVARCRFILVSWLYLVRDTFKLEVVTFHLGLQIIDRVLAKRQVSTKRLQLLGVSAMCIAAKYHEVSAPKLDEWSWITSHSCSPYEVQVMERVILRVIDYDLNYITPIELLLRFWPDASEKEINCTSFLLIYRGHIDTTSELVGTVAQYYGKDTHSLTLSEYAPSAHRIDMCANKLKSYIDTIANRSCDVQELAQSLQI